MQNLNELIDRCLSLDKSLGNKNPGHFMLCLSPGDPKGEWYARLLTAVGYGKTAEEAVTNLIEDKEQRLSNNLV